MSDMTTAGIDLDAIEARANAATPGPWSEKRFEDPAWKDGFAPGVIIAAVARGQGIYANPEGGSYPSADRDFIAHARTDIPALVAEIRALRSRSNKGEG